MHIYQFFIVGHEKAVYRLQLHNHLIASCSKDQTVRIWDTKNNTCAHVLKEHRKEVRCVRMNDDIIVSGSEDDTIGTRVTRVKVTTTLILVIHELTRYFTIV